MNEELFKITDLNLKLTTANTNSCNYWVVALQESRSTINTSLEPRQLETRLIVYYGLQDRRLR